MSAPATTCPNCGATPRAFGQQKCEYCGTPLVAPPAPPSSTAERFARLRASERFEALMRHTPSVAGHTIAGGCAAVLLVVWLAAVGAGWSMAREVGGGVLLTLVPVLMLIAGAVGLGAAVTRTARMASARWERDPARVVGTRAQKRDDSTWYYVTLEFESSERQEYRASGRTVGALEANDVGVAYLKGGELIEFERVRV